jgi:hypothetical protein
MLKKILILSFFVLPINFICAEGETASKGGSWSSYLPDLGIGKACSRLAKFSSLWADPTQCEHDSNTVAKIIGIGFKCKYSRAYRRPMFPCLRSYYNQKPTQAEQASRASFLQSSTGGNGAKLLNMALKWVLVSKEDKKKDSFESVFISEKDFQKVIREFSFYHELRVLLVSNNPLKLLKSDARFKKIDSNTVEILTDVIKSHDKSRKGYFFKVPISHAASFFREIVFEDDDDNVVLLPEKAERKVVKDKKVKEISYSPTRDIYLEWWETYFTKLQYSDHSY